MSCAKLRASLLFWPWLDPCLLWLTNVVWLINSTRFESKTRLFTLERLYPSPLLEVPNNIGSGKKICVWRIFGSERNFESSKNVGSKTIVGLQKKFVSKKNLGLKIFLVQKNFWSKKKFGVKKNFGTEFFFGLVGGLVAGWLPGVGGLGQKGSLNA